MNTAPTGVVALGSVGGNRPQPLGGPGEEVLGAVSGRFFRAADGSPTLQNTGSPLATAIITIEDEPESTTSAPDGAFYLGDVNPGMRVLLVNGQRFPVTTVSGGILDLTPPAITRDTAIQKLRQAIATLNLDPARLQIVGPPFPLPAGTTVGPGITRAKPDQGQDVQLATRQWFFFVDPTLQLGFQHPVHYVFVDAETGETTIRQARWWPAFNTLEYYKNPEFNQTLPDLVQAPPGVVIKSFTPPAPRKILPRLDLSPLDPPQTMAFLVQGSATGAMSQDLADARYLLKECLAGESTLIFESRPGENRGFSQLIKEIQESGRPQDTFLFFFTGHSDETGILETDKTEGFFRNRTLSRKAVQYFFGDKSIGIIQGELGLENMRHGHVMILINACNSGVWAGHEAGDDLTRQTAAGFRSGFDHLTGRKVCVVTSTLTDKYSVSGAFLPALRRAWPAATWASATRELWDGPDPRLATEAANVFMGDSASLESASVLLFGQRAFAYVRDRSGDANDAFPKISAIDPPTALTGQNITLLGSNLGGPGRVLFEAHLESGKLVGKEASIFARSADSVTVRVPAGVVSGKLAFTNHNLVDQGTDSAFSPTDFIMSGTTNYNYTYTDTVSSFPVHGTWAANGTLTTNLLEIQPNQTSFTGRFQFSHIRLLNVNDWRNSLGQIAPTDAGTQVGDAVGGFNVTGRQVQGSMVIQSVGGSFAASVNPFVSTSLTFGVQGALDGDTLSNSTRVTGTIVGQNELGGFFNQPGVINPTGQIEFRLR